MNSSDPFADAIALFRDLKFDFDLDKPSDSSDLAPIDAAGSTLPAVAHFPNDDDFDIVTGEIPGDVPEDIHQDIDEAARRVTQIYLNYGL